MSTASVVGFTQAIVNLNSTGLIGLITAIPKLIAGVVSLTATFGASQVAALGLNGVLELLNINPVMLALSAATIAIGGIVYAQKKAAEDTQQRIDDINSKLSELNDKLSTLNGEYDSLLQKVKDGSATDAEKERLQLINDEIEATKELIKQQTKLKYQEEFGQTTSYETDEYGGVVPVSSNSKTQTDIEKSISDAKKLSDISGKTTAEMDKNHTDMAIYISDMQSYISDLEQYEGQGLLTSQQQSDLDTMRQMVSEYGKYDDAVNVAQRALASYVTEQEAQGNTLSEISRSNAYKLLISNLNEATKAVNENADASNNGIIALKPYSDLISELSSKFDVITSAQDELSQSGVLSYSTVQKLLEAYPNFQNQLTLTKNGFVTTKAALDDLISSQIEEYKISNDNAVSAANELINSETAKQIGYKATTASIYDQITAMQKLAAAQLAMAGSDFINRRLAAGDSLTDASKNPEYQDIVTKATNRYIEISKVYDNLFNSKSNLDNAKDLASSIKANNITKSKSSTDIYVADINKLADAEQKLKNVQNELSQQQIFGDLSDSYSESIASIQKEISLYKQEQIAIKELNAERTKQIQENVSKLQSQGFSVAYNASSNRLAITNMEHINQIVGKTTEETNNLRKAAESLIDTTQTLNDDNIKGVQDWYSSLKSIKSEYEELQSVVSNTVEKAFDKISDLLNKEKEAYEKQKSNLESVSSTVVSYINEYINSLQEQNDELDKQISLQQKLEALDKARTQRNKRVFVEGEGFTWQADSSAVNSAQQEYDAALKEQELSSNIEKLQNYAKAWEDATSSYQNSIDQSLTNDVLGTNWRAKALNADYDSVYSFQRDYNAILEELDADVYGSVANQIQNLDDLKNAWDNSVEEANNTGTDYKTVLDLISTYESGSYSTRLSALSSFVSSAISQYQSLASAAAGSLAITSNSVKSSSGSSSGGSGYITIGDIQNGVGGLSFNSGYSSGSGSDGGSSNSKSSSSGSSSGGGSDGFGGTGDPSDYITNWDDIKGYSTGGVVDDTGIAMLHGGNGHNEVVLNSDSANSLWEYLQTTDLLSQSAVNMMVASNLSSGSSITPISSQSQSFSIGKIYVSGVDNVDELVSAIKTEFPSKMMQSFYKKG